MGVDEVRVVHLPDWFWKFEVLGRGRGRFCGLGMLGRTVLVRNHHFLVFSGGKKVRFGIIAGFGSIILLWDTLI